MTKMGISKSSWWKPRASTPAAGRRTGGGAAPGTLVNTSLDLRRCTFIVTRYVTPFPAGLRVREHLIDLRVDFYVRALSGNPGSRRRRR